MSDFEFKFSNLSDFEIKFSKRVRFRLKSFTKLQILDCKKLQRVRFSVKNFSTCQVSKNCLHPKNHVMVQFTPWKRLTLYFWCFSKEHDFEFKVSKRVRCCFKNFTTRQIWDSKKTQFQSRIERVMFSF